MSDDQPASDKPYDPTPQKLEEARRKGEIVRSSDLNTAVTYAGLLLGALLFGPAAGIGFGEQFMTLFDQANTLSILFLDGGGIALSAGLLRDVLSYLGLVLVLPAALLIIALSVQRAWVFTPDKLLPKLSRISPVQAVQNKYGLNGLFEFAKSAVKLVIYSIVLAVYLWSRSDAILASIYAAPGQILASLSRFILEFLLIVWAISMLVGGVDYLWQWAEHLRKNRMSHKELMDETRQTEGDPHVKQSRRQRGYDIATNHMLGEVPKADVVVVNPTHFAVALKWDRNGGNVPVCVAKGVDEIAAQIRKRASENGVPIFHDPPTARALHATVELGDMIEPDHYRAVAAAIRFADEIRKKAGKLT